MKTTTNYGLNKPEENDYYDIEHFNENADKIDEQLKVAQTHRENKGNPHGVTKSQVGLGNVDNTADKDKPVSTAQQAAINKAIADLVNGAPGSLDTLNELADAMAENDEVVEALEAAISTRAKTSDLTAHTSNKSNPHGVTKAQVGLGNVDNTSDKDKPVSTAQQEAIDDAAVARIITGANPTLESSTAAPFISMQIDGKTTQDGTPTPDAPVDIVGVGDSDILEVKSTGKNLINQDTITTDAYVNSETGKQTSIAECRATDFIPVQEGESYYFSGMDMLNRGNSGAMYNKDKGYVKGINNYVDMQPLVVPKGVAYIKISLWEKYFTDFSKIQLEKGTTKTDYEPYQGETTANIPLSAPLYEDDYIRYNMDGSGELVRNMASVVFNGSEEWKKNSSFETNYLYYVMINDKKKVSNIWCDRLSHKKVSILNEEGGNIDHVGCNGDEHETAFYINVGYYLSENTISAFKAWLAENPITVVYELAEPTVIPLTAEQIAAFKKLYSFDGVTNVMCEGECEVQYLADSESGKAVALVIENAQKSASDASLKAQNASAAASNAKKYTGSGVTSNINFETGEIMAVVPETLSEAVDSMNGSIDDLIGEVIQKADYETGTFNLTWNDYVVTGFQYVKVGRLVMVSGTSRFGKDLVTTEVVSLSGLPFRIGGAGNGTYFWFGTNASNIPSNITTTGNSIQATGSTIEVRNIPTGGISANAPITLVGIYMTD